MRAAQHDRVDGRVQIRRELFAQIPVQRGAGQLAAFDKLHQPAARDGMDLGLAEKMPPQVVKFFLVERHGRRHDEDAAAGMALDRGLERRLGADDRKLRKFAAERLRRRGRGGVAGDDDRLHILCEKKIGTLLRCRARAAAARRRG